MKTKYFSYLWYIIQHKWNVGIECLKAGLWWHAITHDLSKFRPSEFFPYARFFTRKNRTKNYKTSDETDMNFQSGWCLHQKRNRHHWNYWVSVTRKNEIAAIPMPMKYVRQMICDWKGMARKFGGTWWEYYWKNRDDMILHAKTMVRINQLLKREDV